MHTMKTNHQGIIPNFLSSLALLLLLGVFAATPAFAKPTNIVMILIDDMGWGDFSCFGNQAVKTPNIDRLAQEGLRFENFYVNSPICSPSRCALTTGQYPQRWKITSFLDNRASNERRGMAQWLDPAAPSLARFLRKAGYSTGRFGKWHLGGQRDVTDAPPITDYGFDVSLTNFEGIGPKLLPLTMKPGAEKAGRIGKARRISVAPSLGCSVPESRADSLMLHFLSWKSRCEMENTFT